MKRSFSFSAALGTAAYVLTMAAPALAQDYYSSGEDAAAGAVACGIWACIMIPAVLLGVFNIWMLIDAILRQEHEYPQLHRQLQADLDPAARVRRLHRGRRLLLHGLQEDQAW